MQNRERLIELMKYLYIYTDDDHNISTSELAEIIMGENTQARRKTIKADIATLEQLADLDIICQKGSPDKYNWGNRLFDVAEIKFLIDCVSASGTITETMSEKLIEKLKSLLSIYQTEKVDTHLFIPKHLKMNNQQIFYTIDMLTDAIHMKKNVSFHYWRYAPTKEKIYLNDGEREISSPYGLAFDNGRYYLIAYSYSRDEIVAYRVDRIGDLQVEKEDIKNPPVGFSMEAYISGAFRMYSAEHTKVTLLCNNIKMNSIVDYFGLDTEIEIIDEEHFKVEVEVKAVETFYSWIFQSRGALRILGPDWVKEEYAARVRAAAENL